MITKSIMFPMAPKWKNLMCMENESLRHLLIFLKFVSITNHVCNLLKFNILSWWHKKSIFLTHNLSSWNNKLPYSLRMKTPLEWPTHIFFEMSIIPCLNPSTGNRKISWIIFFVGNVYFLFFDFKPLFCQINYDLVESNNK